MSVRSGTDQGDAPGVDTESEHLDRPPGVVAAQKSKPRRKATQRPQGSDQIRQAFSKRKKGLVVKAFQLSKLTDAKVFVFLVNGKGSSWAYATPGFGGALTAAHLKHMRDIANVPDTGKFFTEVMPHPAGADVDDQQDDRQAYVNASQRGEAGTGYGSHAPLATAYPYADPHARSAYAPGPVQIKAEPREHEEPMRYAHQSQPPRASTLHAATSVAPAAGGISKMNSSPAAFFHALLPPDTGAKAVTTALDCSVSSHGFDGSCLGYDAPLARASTPGAPARTSCQYDSATSPQLLPKRPSSSFAHDELLPAPPPLHVHAATELFPAQHTHGRLSFPGAVYSGSPHTHAPYTQSCSASQIPAYPKQSGVPSALDLDALHEHSPVLQARARFLGLDHTSDHLSHIDTDMWHAGRAAANSTRPAGTTRHVTRSLSSIPTYPVAQPGSFVYEFNGGVLGIPDSARHTTQPPQEPLDWR